MNPVDELLPSNDMDFFSSDHTNKVSLDTNMTDGNEDEKNAEDDDNDWLSNEEIDLVEKTVLRFREQRLSMVQSLKQYVLIYETIMEWLVKQSVLRPAGLSRQQTEV